MVGWDFVEAAATPFPLHSVGRLLAGKTMSEGDATLCKEESVEYKLPSHRLLPPGLVHQPHSDPENGRSSLVWHKASGL